MTTQLDNAQSVLEVLQSRANEEYFSGELNKSIMSGQVAVKEKTDYIAYPISGEGGLIHLVEASTVRKEGVTTFDGNKFKQNVAKVIDALEVTVGIGNPSDFGAIKFDKTHPAQLQNAHLIVEQKGNTILEKKVSDIKPNGTQTSGNELFTKLQLPLILVDNEEFSINLRFPKGSSVAAAATAADTQIVKVALRAYETGRR